MRLSHVGLALVVLVGCGRTSGVGRIRFANRAPVWTVNDRLDTPVPPQRHRFVKKLYHLDGRFVRPLTDVMDTRLSKPVADVNSLGEVPNSTWFTNRIGVRPLTVAEVRHGPNRSGSPNKYKPWTVLGTKVGGASVGFMIRDTRGYRYVLKFDTRGFPEMETAADVITQRLLWACGFNVPEDSIVHFNRNDLKLAPNASVKDALGNKRRMTLADLTKSLAKVEIASDGQIRGLVSKLLAGKPLGGAHVKGTRKGDPNDRVANERRRRIRGSAAIFAWLNHTDVKQDNTLAMWVSDPKDAKTHYVMHYLVDFGNALGALGYLKGFAFEGFSPVFGLSNLVKSLLSLGLWKRPWDGIRAPALRGVGLFESQRYSPARWHVHTSYLPFNDRDRFDEFWGAKILIRFSRAQIRAAVEQGRLSDPAAVGYLVKTLVERQRKTAQHWFSKVAPLDRFKVVGAKLCFEDLSVRYKLDATASTSSYNIRFYDYAGRLLAANKAVIASSVGRVCTGNIQAGRSHRGYTIVRLETARRGKSMNAPVYVHLARDKTTRQLRVIGVVRR